MASCKQARHFSTRGEKCPATLLLDREGVVGSRRWDDIGKPEMTLTFSCHLGLTFSKFKVYLCLARFSSVIFGDFKFNPTFLRITEQERDIGMGRASSLCPSYLLATFTLGVITFYKNCPRSSFRFVCVFLTGFDGSRVVFLIHLFCHPRLRDLILTLKPKMTLAPLKLNFLTPMQERGFQSNFRTKPEFSALLKENDIGPHL